MKKQTDLAILILRLGTGILFLLHGIDKARNGIGFIEGLFTKNGLPGALAYLVYLGEIVAPLMLIFGFRTKIGSLLIMGTLLVIVFLTGMGKMGTLSQTGAWSLEVQGLFFTGALALFILGGGKYAASTKHKWD